MSDETKDVRIGRFPPTPVKIEPSGLFSRCIITVAANSGLAWTGSQFASHTGGIGRYIQIANFDSPDEARDYIAREPRLILADAPPAADSGQRMVRA